MKFFLIIVATMALVGRLMAQENLQNSDFADGTTHWHGDCKTAASEMSTDFTNASSAQGIVVELHHSTWTKVTQDIHEYKGGGNLVLTITYQTSPDFKLSDHKFDRNEALVALGFPQANLPLHEGQILAFLDVQPENRASVSTSGNVNTYTIFDDRITVTTFVPTPDGKSQTYTAAMRPPPATPDNKPTFCIAFPPGDGNITLLRVSLAPGQNPQFGPGQHQ